MDVFEFDVNVDPKFGLGALLTLRSIDLSQLNDPDNPLSDEDDAKASANTIAEEEVKKKFFFSKLEMRNAKM